MKTTLIYLVFTIFLLNACNAKNNFSEQEILAINQSQDLSLGRIQLNDTLLNNIQQKVLNAFVNSKISETDKHLVSLEQELLELNKNNNNSIVVYWYSYACYYHSILYMIIDNTKKSEEIINIGIKKLNEVKQMNSEHFALLAMMESFSIQFAAGMEAASISNRVKQNAEKALQLDSLNLRAYFVLGSNDFYTPEHYGGGKKAESYFKKAITLNDQSISNQYLPSWGKNSAFELLIKSYIKKQQWDNAKKYYKEAISLYPNDYMINQLAGELVNH